MRLAREAVFRGKLKLVRLPSRSLGVIALHDVPTYPAVTEMCPILNLATCQAGSPALPVGQLPSPLEELPARNWRSQGAIRAIAGGSRKTKKKRADVVGQRTAISRQAESCLQTPAGFETVP